MGYEDWYSVWHAQRISISGWDIIVIPVVDNHSKMICFFQTASLIASP